MRGFSRRNFIASLALGGMAAALGIDGILIEPKRLVARRVSINLARLPENFHGFRIAQISDIHYGPYMHANGVEFAMRLAESFQPDLIVLTGDFVSHPFGIANGRAGANYIEPCADVLTRWKHIPQVAILGNHDHWNNATIVAQGLKERGIPVLRNSAMPIDRSHSRIWIAGIDDALVGAADLGRALSGVPPGELTILLAHEPDFADHAARFPIDLQLSGHSHGGQVRIPGLGAPILPKMARKYPIGLNLVGSLQVYTNVGVGVINPPIRFLCPPEVTFLTLGSGKIV